MGSRENRSQSGGARETWEHANLEVQHLLATQTIPDLTIIQAARYGLLALDGHFYFGGFRDSLTLDDEETLLVARHDEERGDFEFVRAAAGKTVSALQQLVKLPVVGGQSGGPAFDDRWRLAGLMTNQGAGPEKYGTFIPSEVLRLFLESRGAPGLSAIEDPSVLLWREGLDFAIALPAYAAGARATWNGWGVGADGRGVKPPGNREPFKETCIYFAWMDP